MANYVQKAANSIGYVAFAYAKQNNLIYTMLKNSAGQFVEPSFESFEDAASTAKQLLPEDVDGCTYWKLHFSCRIR